MAFPTVLRTKKESWFYFIVIALMVAAQVVQAVTWYKSVSASVSFVPFGYVHIGLIALMLMYLIVMLPTVDSLAYWWQCSHEQMVARLSDRSVVRKGAVVCAVWHMLLFLLSTVGFYALWSVDRSQMDAYHTVALTCCAVVTIQFPYMAISISYIVYTFTRSYVKNIELVGTDHAYSEVRAEPQHGLPSPPPTSSLFSPSPSPSPSQCFSPEPVVTASSLVTKRSSFTYGPVGSGGGGDQNGHVQDTITSPA